MRASLVGGERFKLLLLAAFGVSPMVACAGRSASSGDDDDDGEIQQPVPERLACRNGAPKPGDPTGSIEQCDGGWRHRAQAVTCPSELPRALVVEPHSPGFDQCQVDADCNEIPHGYCVPGNLASMLTSNYCRYGCVTNADCNPGHSCECGSPVGDCVRALCEADADCGGNALCASFSSTPGCPGTAFACQTPRDECAADTDCAVGEQCTWLEAKNYRVCSGPTCQVGRPFLVNGEERLADVVERSDWSGAEPRAEMASLTAEARGRLGAAWAEIGRMEHASIAAFARFELELLAFGAPTEFVEACGRALSDEIRHARLAFGLASGYAAKTLGPGGLALSDAAGAQPFDASVEGALLEGCIGETVAALEALEALTQATDPAVRDVLSQIAEDEARHAELAWRFVQWALGRADASLGKRLQARVARELTRSRRHFEGEPATDVLDAHVLAAHGVLSDAARRRVRALALRDVVEPCLCALLRAAQAPFSCDSGTEAASSPTTFSTSTGSTGFDTWA